MHIINFFIIVGTIFNLAIAGQFGKNIVQYKDFDWYYTQTKHFDIYVSDSTGYHLNSLERDSEDAYDKIQNLFNWSLKDRVSIIVYSSHNDFQQTNVIGSHLPEGVGGVTELLKNRVVIPFDGSYKEFKDVLYHELVHAFINDCVYGGSLKGMISSQITVRIPLWMNEGLAEYIADKWNTNSDMWIRDMVLNGNNLPHINQLNGYWAYRGGQSVWNFIVEKWGEESIAEIIKRIKETGNVSSGLKASIAVNVEQLSDQWHKYLKKEYWEDINNKNELQDFSVQLTNHKKIKNHYNIAPAISPNGNEVAIFSDRDGIMNLFVINSLDGKIIKKIIEGQRTTEFEELHILKPGITWSPDGNKIAVAVKSGKSDALITINLKNNKKDVKRFQLEGIFRPTWNPKYNQIAFIGNNGFASDIYVYDIDTDQLINYTNDWYTDDQVSWDEKGENLYFISNRGDNTNTNQHIVEDVSEDVFEQSDIYRLNIDSQIIDRLTYTEENESYPFYSDSKNMLGYISDKNGINNIYLKLDSKRNGQPITNVLTGITQLSWNSTTDQLIFTGFNNGGYDIFTIYEPMSYLDENIQLTNANWKLKVDDESFVKIDHNQGDEISNKRKYENYVFLDISDQNFTTKEKDEENITFNKNFNKWDISDRLKMFRYKTRFTLDYANMDYAYNTRREGTGLVNFIFSDILGNHKVIINTEMEIRLKGSDYMVEYHNLTKRNDYKYTLYHFGQEYLDYVFIDVNEDDEIVCNEPPDYCSVQPKLRYQTLGFQLESKYAINKFQRFTNSVEIKRDLLDEFIYKIDNNDNIDYDEVNNKDYTKNFIIPSIGYDFDNTLWYETYPIKGRRISLRYSNSILNSESSLNFHLMTVDLRKYFAVKNGISTAFRFFAGTLGGSDMNNQAARFRVGGTNYLPIFNKAKYDHIYDVNSIDQVYYDIYVMPLRGVPIGAKSGNNVLVFNSEIRLPFLMYYFPAISFLGKINAVFFSDIGVVWNDDFIKFNDTSSWKLNDLFNGYSLYPESDGGPNPNDRFIDQLGWVWSFGFGPRFIFLGMPWQLDYAWQYDPYKKEFSSSRWYLGIGLDF